MAKCFRNSRERTVRSAPDAHVLDHPEKIPAFTGRHIHWQIERLRLRGLSRAALQPAMNFGMAMCKGEHSGSVMVRSGQIDPFRVIGFVDEVTVVDAVRVFVEEDE